MNNLKPDQPKSSGDFPPSALSVGVDALRLTARQVPPTLLARRTDCQYVETGPGQGEFRLPLFGGPILVRCPELVAYAGQAALDLLCKPCRCTQALLLYHFTSSDGTPLSNRWVSFGDLTDGRMYQQAFQGYAGDKLTRHFGERIEDFRQACQTAGGQPAEIGDAAFIFTPLPRVPLLVTYWLGEDEIPSACKILFDASARNHLPIDVCAILGSMLASRILKASPPVPKPAGG